MNHKRPRRPGNITLRVTSSSASADTTSCLDTSLRCQYAGVEVTRNTADIPTTVLFTNRFRGSITFLSKQYASIIAPAARYSLNKPGNDSLLPWCNECTHTTAMAVLSRTKIFRFGQHELHLCGVKSCSCAYLSTTIRQLGQRRYSSKHTYLQHYTEDSRPASNTLIHTKKYH